MSAISLHDAAFAAPRPLSRSGSGQNDVYDYGFSCAVCEGPVTPGVRARLARRCHAFTLCRSCLDRSLDLARSVSAALRREHRRLQKETRAQVQELREQGWRQTQSRRELATKRERARRMAAERPAFVYHLISRHDEILYIGKTVHVLTRLHGGPSSHSATKDWFRRVERVRVHVFASEDAALAAEAHGIQNHRPRFNRAMPTPPDSCPEPIAVYEGALRAEQL